MSQVSSGSPDTSALASMNDFRQGLSDHNIFSDREFVDLAKEKAFEIIDSYCFPGMELSDAKVNEVKDWGTSLHDANEHEIMACIGYTLIPRLGPSEIVAMNCGRIWDRFAPVPSVVPFHTNQSRLPELRPTITFGYSRAAFTQKNYRAATRLVDEKRRSFATPNGSLYFPYLVVNAMSPASGGHLAARYYASYAGAFVMYGVSELMKRAGLSIERDQPLFFSLSMDNELAVMRMHWIASRGMLEDQTEFDDGEYDKFRLDDREDLERMGKVLDGVNQWAGDGHLGWLYSALKAYGDKIQFGEAT